MIKTANELVTACVDVAKNYKTLYVMGCFGAPMTEKNKARYCNNHSYNKRAARTKMIQAASTDTFGFDCVNLIKGLMWGWCGDITKTYGGASYKANDVPDVSANGMIKLCNDVTKDFSTIQPGEAVWMDGHIGVYIGDGLAVESTPAWKNCVQITAVHNIGKKDGYKGRKWTSHGKFPFIEYPEVTGDKPAFSVLEWQKAAIADGFAFPKHGADGEWGAECESVARKAICKRRLTYKYKNLTRLVQEAVGVSADGKFGSNTKKFVIAYQKRNGLTADGEVGLNTWRVMLGVK